MANTALAEDGDSPIVSPTNVASDADAEALRDAFARAGIAGPHPLDADAIDLAYFGTGWDLVERDLKTGLPPDQLAAVTAVLQQVGVHDAFVARDNLVNFKKVTLGIYHGAAMLGTDLRRMACFFRGPPATLSASGATPEASPEVATAAASEAASLVTPSAELKTALGAWERDFVRLHCRRPTRAEATAMVLQALDGLPEHFSLFE